MSFLYWFDVSKFTNDTEYFFHVWIIHFPFLLCEALFSYPLPFCFLWELSHFSYRLLWALRKLQQFMDTLLAQNGLGKTPLDLSSDMKKWKELPAFSSRVQCWALPFLHFCISFLQQYLSCTYYVSENVVLGSGVTSRKKELFWRSSQPVGEEVRKWKSREQSVYTSLREAHVGGGRDRHRRRGPP